MLLAENSKLNEMLKDKVNDIVVLQQNQNVNEEKIVKLESLLKVRDQEIESNRKKLNEYRYNEDELKKQKIQTDKYKQAFD